MLVVETQQPILVNVGSNLHACQGGDNKINFVGFWCQEEMAALLPPSVNG